MTLEPVFNMLHNIRLHPSRLDKENLIKEYLNSEHGELFKKVIIYALHPFKMYKTRNIEFLKLSNDDPYKCGQNVDRIFECLDFLAEKNGCTVLENEILSKFASIDKATVDVVRRIVTKDLRCGSNIKTFRKFIELPEFNVMLCSDDLKKFEKKSNNFRNAVMSIKLDGVRCWSTVTSYRGVILHQSRSGKPFPNFDVFNPLLREHAAKIHSMFNIDYPITFDGEVESKDKDFQNLMTQIRRLGDIDPNNFLFNIFDIVLLNVTFKERYKMLKESIEDSDNVKLLRHYSCPFNTVEKILQYTEKIYERDVEGIVLKIVDSFYQFKRSNDWCKVKGSKTIDLEVTGVEEGTGKNEGILGALICNYGGKKVKVGSGFDDEERIDFFHNPPKIIEVEYQKITRDKSLRNPSFKRVREDKE